MRAVTWWGHSSVSLALGDVRVATDPLLTRRLYHLVRSSPVPPPEAAEADVVLVSHLHYDHLHVPSLDRFHPDVPVVVPAGAERAVPRLAGRHLVPVRPGDCVLLAGVEIEVLPANHAGTRNMISGTECPALGFRLTTGGTSVWYPGDTGPAIDFSAVGPVDLAVVPIGGWGPTLGHEHLNPEQAAHAVAQVRARWALAVHYGTFWPVTMRRLHPTNHQRLFVAPPARFREAVAGRGLPTLPLTPQFAEYVELDA